MFKSLWLKRAFIVIATFTIVSCSVVTLGYNRLPLLTIFELNSIVDLTDEQENLSRIQLDAWLEWHREKHLPQYIVKLEPVSYTHLTLPTKRIV